MKAETTSEMIDYIACVLLFLATLLALFVITITYPVWGIYRAWKYWNTNDHHNN